MKKIISIFGVKYSVELAEIPGDFAPNCQGTCNIREKRIVVGKHAADRMRTFWHELAHAAWWEMGRPTISACARDDEQAADWLDAVMSAFIRENGLGIIQDIHGLLELELSD